MALLTLDRNGNGKIDNGEELFGDASLLQSGGRASNGFVALRDFDSNTDGRIDSQDSVFTRLRLWLDANHNGVSEPTELSTLSQAGVTAIFTTYQENRYRDGYGNEYRLEGSALVDHDGPDKSRRVFDVFFKIGQ